MGELRDRMLDVAWGVVLDSYGDASIDVASMEKIIDAVLAEIGKTHVLVERGEWQRANAQPKQWWSWPSGDDLPQ